MHLDESVTLSICRTHKCHTWFGDSTPCSWVSRLSFDEVPHHF
jgi:hypothetical protein